MRRDTLVRGLVSQLVLLILIVRRADVFDLLGQR